LKKGINIWSFPQADIAGNIRLAKTAGFDGIELALNETGPLSLQSTDEQIASYRALADAEGIEITSLATGLYWTYSLTSPDAQRRAKAMDIVRFQLKAAKLLGVDAILVVPGCVGADFAAETEPVPYDVAYDRAREAMRVLAPEAEAMGVKIGLENVWNKFLLSPLEMRQLIDEIGSPYVGCYFDVGNVVRTGYPEHWIDILGSRIVRVHIKDFSEQVGNIAGFVDLLAGDTNFPAVTAALERIGYTGYLTAEMGTYKHYAQASIDNISRSMDYILGRVAQ
jgi:L-ribulose-5-phosphate 3-epimerase